jgi:hypothetical protein
MGFDDREMVALIGAHALGRCHTDRSGFDGPWNLAISVGNIMRVPVDLSVNCFGPFHFFWIQFSSARRGCTDRRPCPGPLPHRSFRLRRPLELQPYCFHEWDPVLLSKEAEELIRENSRAEVPGAVEAGTIGVAVTDKSTGTLMMLPTDMALMKDKGFKKHVERYAKDSERTHSWKQ